MKWLFASSDRYSLGVFRVILLGWFFTLYAEDYFDAHLLIRPLALTGPTVLVRLLGFGLVENDVARGALLAVAWLSLVTSLLGIFTRPSLFVFAFANAYIESVRYSFGYFAHSHVLPCLAVLMLALAPRGADVLSIDAWLRARRTGGRVLDGLRDEIPVWPVRFIQLHLALLLFASGVAKLRWGGLEWLDGATLGSYLSGEFAVRLQFFAGGPAEGACAWRDGYGLAFPIYHARMTPLGVWLSGSELMLRVSSWGTLFLELVAPILMLTNRWLWAGIAFALLFHLAVFAMMEVNFFPHALCFAVFVDWRRDQSSEHLDDSL